jgi:hypothetical protein
MEELGKLLGQRPSDDHAATLAAAVLAQANEVLLRVFEYGPDLARAVSYNSGELVIESIHGAVTAKLQAEREKLQAEVTARMQRVFPRAALPINRIAIRTN